jgi:hypothetical protein
MKTKKKKPTNAVTLLTRIETLLSDVIDECSDIEKSVEKNVRELLVSAQASIGSAIDFFRAAPSPAARKKTTAKRKAKPTVKAKKRPSAPAARKRALKT